MPCSIDSAVFNARNDIAINDELLAQENLEISWSSSLKKVQFNRNFHIPLPSFLF